MASFFWLLSLGWWLVGVVMAGKLDQCYAPNGALMKYTGGSMMIPLHACPPGSDGHATCCAEGDVCSGTNRLCYNPGGNAVWRNFCTDATWKSTSCSPLCKGSSEWDGGPVQMTPCADGTYCCGGNNTDCCNNHQGTYAFAGVPINATSSDSDSGSKMPPAGIAGIVVGVIGIISLGICMALLLRLRRERSPKAHRPLQEPIYLQDQVAPNPIAPPLNSHPSVSDRHYPSVTSRHYPSTTLQSKPSVRSHYVAEKTLPDLPKEVYEMGGEGITRFEVSGSGMKDDKKFGWR